MLTHSPIIILGVSRSGTTLLRVLLGSHSQVAAPPETPWLTGAYGEGSLRELVETLSGSSVGPIGNLSQVDERDLWDAARAFAVSLLGAYAAKRAKSRVVLKTPKDLTHLDALARLFPQSPIIHLTRDGRDVAASTVRRRAMLGSSLGAHGEITALNAVRRWRDAEDDLARRTAKGELNVIAHLRYEELVKSPRSVLESLCGALGLDFEEGMLRYDMSEHDLPTWEAGSMDVRAHESIDDASIGRYRTDLSYDDKRAIDAELGDDLVRLGYARCLD